MIIQNASPAYSPCLQQFQDSVSFVASDPFQRVTYNLFLSSLPFLAWFRAQSRSGRRIASERDVILLLGLELDLVIRVGTAAGNLSSSSGAAFVVGPRDRRRFRR
jgi:hypothetical protein